ncbi:MAG: signal peptidase I [Micrococcales bacterium]|nr:signal peptidase I [Micrococcales bacterium]
MSILTAPPAPRPDQPPAGQTPILAPAPTTKPEKRKGLLHYLGLGASMGLLGFVLLLAALVIGVPAVSGSTPYTIVTASMEPSLPPGTLVVVKPVATADVRIGDVMTYQLKSGRPEVVTHRVIGIQQPDRAGGKVSFVTKGDANDTADPVVRPVQVRGTVWYSIPLIGWVNNVVNGDMRATVIPIAAALLFLYAGGMVVSHAVGTVRARRRATAGPATLVESP